MRFDWICTLINFDAEQARWDQSRTQSNLKSDVEMLAASAAAPKKRATKGDDDSKPPKKPRKQAVQIPEGKKIADAILAAPDEYSVPTDSEAVRKLLIVSFRDLSPFHARAHAVSHKELASYARSLESHAELGAKIAAKAKPPKTPEELQAAADKLARTIANGISKVMKVRPQFPHSHPFDLI